jgi:trans-aconitate methyltransferase
MAFFDNPENVQKYLDMSEGYDGRELVGTLREYLPERSSLLELGMGPGKDLLLLSRFYRVTGSDSSSIFVDRFLEEDDDLDVLVLDAVSIETETQFECIYSNKVLHHLSREELAASFLRQYDVLKSSGILMHSFWYGDREEFIEDLRFVYYREESILAMVRDRFEVLSIERYTEFEDCDSFFVILRKI